MSESSIRVHEPHWLWHTWNLLAVLLRL